jgi:proteasome lid subunit RPN8/RPN11
VTPLRIPQTIADDLVAHARELAPHECCGLLAGRDRQITHLYRIANVVAIDGADRLAAFDDAKLSHLAQLSPEERAEIAFVMDAQDLALAQRDMRRKELDLLVIYHSHPHDPARPSVTDIKIATDYEDYWPKINLPLPQYLLISLQSPHQPDIKLYDIRQGRVTQASYEIPSPGMN